MYHLPRITGQRAHDRSSFVFDFSCHLAFGHVCLVMYVPHTLSCNPPSVIFFALQYDQLKTWKDKALTASHFLPGPVYFHTFTARKYR